MNIFQVGFIIFLPKKPVKFQDLIELDEFALVRIPNLH